MKGFILSIVVSLFVLSASAQSSILLGASAKKNVAEAHELRMSAGNPIPTYIEFEKSSQINFESWESYFRTTFQLPNSYGFQLLSEQHDEFGMTHYRFVQTYNTIMIEHAHLIVHVKNGLVVSINGLAYNNPLTFANTTISEVQGLETCKNYVGAKQYKWESKEEESYLKIEQNNSEATYYPTGDFVYVGKEGSTLAEDITLCRKYNVYAIEPLSRHEIYVDAKSNEIVFVNEQIHHANANGVANTAYSGTRAIITDSTEHGYRLRETTRGNGISTFNMQKSTQHGQAIDFKDSNNVWSNFNANLDQYATDAHWGAEKTYDYFDTIHGRNSIDGNGFRLLSYVHYGNNYNNAFWDGQRMTYGDGNQMNTPLTSLDIAGHEIAHGLTNFSAGLIYRKESGALNESFSDIFGASIEEFARPTKFNWLLGEDIGGAFRNMANPKLYSDPNTYDGQNWISQNCTPTNGNDWCGVHTNSGVQNFWFYLLTDGGSGVNDIGDTFLVNGIGKIDAAKVAFRNLTVYLTPTSDYQDARFYGIKSAIDIFGGCSPEVESVTNAWYAVGVGGAYTQGVNASFVAVYDTVFCSIPATVQFHTNSNNVSNFHWQFGDGDTSDLPFPVHVYDSIGVYTVSLHVDGGVCGKDSIFRTAYINVDTANLCSYSMIRNSHQTINECRGRLYDNGGLNGDYELNSKDTVVISSSSADFLVLKLNSIFVESGFKGNCNHDYIEVFDGPSVKDRSLGRFCTAVQLTDSIISSGPNLTLVFLSDEKITKSGFVAEWYCLNATQIPVADFIMKYDTTFDGKNEFYNRTLNGANTWFWNFGDGNTSTEKNPRHSYLNNGTYTVSLLATNGIGSATKSSQVLVARPNAPQVLGDTNCINGRVKLVATGSGRLDWFKTTTSMPAVFVGDTFRVNLNSNDTSFYVSSYNQNPRVIGTPIFINGTGSHSDTTAKLFFDVLKPTLVESVIINSNRRGERVVVLRNSSNEIIDTRIVNVPNVPSQVALNFEIGIGRDYSLSIGNRNPSAYINYTGAAYPYQFGNFMSITSSSLGNSAYPFFYYFIARELPRISKRVQVTGFVDTSCIITSLKDEVSLDYKFDAYPNPTSGDLMISTNSNDSYSLQLFDLNGKAVSDIYSNQLKSTSIQLDDIQSGMYFLKIKTKNGLISKKIIKSH